MEKYVDGQIIWRDLTVPNTEEVRDFYKSVMGWETTEHDMETYVDYNVVIKETKEVISGICHNIESNKDMPPVWMNYVYVDSVEESCKKVERLGGEVLVRKSMGESSFAVIKDPAGAIIAIIH